MSDRRPPGEELVFVRAFTDDDRRRGPMSRTRPASRRQRESDAHFAPEREATWAQTYVGGCRIWTASGTAVPRQFLQRESTRRTVVPAGTPELLPPSYHFGCCSREYFRTYPGDLVVTTLTPLTASGISATAV
ncbi:hypothetical protein HPB50_024514 [Hyalomma asiaticum]|uniref:Uncharacterized protein n=1 Tax=Hyalomma asiaticum TaxID=266040 RepID=A0ACB7TQ33_HYAAI|nr:hypothetical protein HPB50_024514 [Hyalomma asiaticum]